MGIWVVSCGSCAHAWNLAGYWSEFERQAIESRPCPRCGAYTLKSPEPTPERRRRRRQIGSSHGHSHLRRAG